MKSKAKRRIILIVVFLVFAAVALVPSFEKGRNSNDVAEKALTVKQVRVSRLPYLPIGEYPAKDMFPSYYGGSWEWAVTILADPTGEGVFKLYTVAPEYLSIIFGDVEDGEGYIVVKYQDVTLHLP